MWKNFSDMTDITFRCKAADKDYVCK